MKVGELESRLFDFPIAALVKARTPHGTYRFHVSEVEDEGGALVLVLEPLADGSVSA